MTRRQQKTRLLEPSFFNGGENGFYVERPTIL